MTFEDAERQILNGATLHHRNCRVCKQPITVTLSKAKLPVLVSCRCREQKQTNLIPLSWHEMELIWQSRDHHDFSLT